jgi:hypothetical protein
MYGWLTAALLNYWAVIVGRHCNKLYGVKVRIHEMLMIIIELQLCFLNIFNLVFKRKTN